MAASSVGILSNIFTAPSVAFAALKERPSPWLPLLLILAGYFVVSYVYMQAVDLPWLMDRQMSQAPNMTEEQRAQAVENALRLSPTVYGAIGGASTCIVIVVVFAIVALYYTGVSFATNDGVKFKQWFSLTAWGALPVVFGLLASLVNLFAVDARFLPQEEMNPLSFGQLFGLESDGLPVMQRILISLDVTALWSTVLAIIGYQIFSQRSITRAAVVVLGPWVVLALLGVLTAL